MRRIMAGAAVAALTGCATAEIPDGPWTEDILFGFNREPMDADGIMEVSDISDLYLAGGADSALVSGHADTVGDAAYNLGLGERRAQVVRRNLLARGVPSEAITVVTLGESDLAVETPDGVRKQANRRVLVTVDGFGTNPPFNQEEPYDFPLPPAAPTD